METLDELVSVVLPVRHWCDASAIAVNSILRQTHENIELLLIGQSCIDPLAEGLRKSGIHDKRIRLLSRQSPGIVGALNTGLRSARGTYIARMDDDDIAYPDRLEVQLRYLHHNPHIGLCAALVRFIDKHCGTDCVGAGNRQYAKWLNAQNTPELIAKACYAENPMPHPTLLAARDVWIALEGYREVDAPEDHDLVLRAMLKGIPMGKPAGILLDWREHENRLTRTDPRYRRQAFISLSAQALVHKGGALQGNLQRAVWIAGTGKHARHWHDELSHLGVKILGFVDMARPGAQREKRKRQVINYEQLLEQRSDELVISAVSQASGRDAIRQFCQQQHWQEGRDFIIGC